MISKSQPLKNKPKVLIFIVAYNAEKNIEKVLNRIPQKIYKKYLQFFKNLGFTVKIEDIKFDLNNKHCYEKKYYTDFFAFQK